MRSCSNTLIRLEKGSFISWECSAFYVLDGQIKKWFCVWWFDLCTMSSTCLRWNKKNIQRKKLIGVISSLWTTKRFLTLLRRWTAYSVLCSVFFIINIFSAPIWSVFGTRLYPWHFLSSAFSKLVSSFNECVIIWYSELLNKQDGSEFHVHFLTI